MERKRKQGGKRGGKHGGKQGNGVKERERKSS